MKLLYDYYVDSVKLYQLIKEIFKYLSTVKFL